MKQIFPHKSPHLRLFQVQCPYNFCATMVNSLESAPTKSLQIHLPLQNSEFKAKALVKITWTIPPQHRPSRRRNIDRISISLYSIAGIKLKITWKGDVATPPVGNVSRMLFWDSCTDRCGCWTVIIYKSSSLSRLSALKSGTKVPRRISCCTRSHKLCQSRWGPPTSILQKDSTSLFSLTLC